jgi:hypothetical protein
MDLPSSSRPGTTISKSEAVQPVAAERFAIYALAAVFVGAVSSHIAAIDGAFLADDYGNLYAIFAASERGALWTWILSLFHSPLGNGTYAFRPLQYVSYGLDWLAFGPNPVGWRASTIVLYFTNAAVAGLVVRRWLHGTPANAALGGMIAASLLAAYPFAGDVAYYPGCRADSLTCLFSLLYLWTIPVDGRSTTRDQVLRVGWLACALMSKESAMLLPAVATMLCIATASAVKLEGLARFRYAVSVPARETWLSWAVLGGYLAWRARLFNSIWKVYLSSTPPHDAAELLARLSSFRFIVTENIGSHYLLWSIAAILALVWGVMSQNLRIVPKTHTAMIVALCGASVLYFVAPASSFDVSNSFGEGARHFYSAWMYTSLFLAMLLAWRPSRVMPMLALVLILFAGQAQSVAQWHSAAMQMKRILGAIEGFAVTVRDDQYALLLLPDHQRIALFARNAQGAIVMRPIQRDDYLSRMAIMLSQDFAHWSELFARGKVSELKGGKPFDRADFLGLYCWNPSVGRIVPLTSGAFTADPGAWREAAERNFARAGCLSPL